MRYILWFENLCKGDIEKVGGKAANLGEMTKAGFPVPPGFAISTDAFEEFLESAKRFGKKAKIAEIVSKVDPKDTENLEKTSIFVREIIESTPIPDRIREEIRAAYKDLCSKVGVENLPVAIRSSATAEDVADASFAGQQDTFLWARGVDEVMKYVTKCWSSLYTPRAIAYRATKGFDHFEVSISVVVQKMVNSRSSGVMFTLNPTNGDVSQIVIESTWGLGEALVSGSVTPDRFVVDKVTMEIVDRTISEKLQWTVFDSDKGEVVHEEIPENLRSEQSISDEEVIKLAEIGKKIEMHYGRAQDIEWAIDRDVSAPHNIFITQSRPETVWSERKKGSVIGKKSAYELIMNRALTPFKLPK
jgi:pyruvate,water dikinase